MSDCDEEQATRDTDDWQASIAECKNPKAHWVEKRQYGVIIHYVEGCSEETQRECLVGCEKCPLMHSDRNLTSDRKAVIERAQEVIRREINIG